MGVVLARGGCCGELADCAPSSSRVGVYRVCGAYRLAVEKPAQRLCNTQEVITARVIELPASGHMATVEIVSAQRMPRGTRALLYCQDLTAPTLYETVRTEVEWRQLHPSQERFRADGVFLQAYPLAFDETAMTVVKSPTALESWMITLRERLLSALRERLGGEEGALLEGICLGEKTRVSEETSAAFRHAGLPHILVVSGLHLSIISAAIYALLRHTLANRRLAAVITMVAVLLFMLLIGLTPSAVRAGLMCLVMLGGLLFIRRADGLNSMGLALVLLLLTNPYSLLDAGLQLSFGAAGGVLCLSSPIARLLERWHLPSWASGGIGVTLAASLPIAPILALYFGEISLVSPLANLLAIAPASLALILGWVGMLCGLCAPLGFLADGVLYLTGRLVRWPMLVAHGLGGLPFAVVPTAFVWTILYLTGACVLGILCIWKCRKKRWRRVIAALCALLLLASAAHTLVRCGTMTVTVSRREGVASLLVERDGSHGLIVQDAAGIYANDALERACGGELQFVVVLDGKPADAARLTTLLRRIEVRRLIINEQNGLLTGLGLTAEPLRAEHPLSLWTDVTLTGNVAGGWRLSCRDTTLLLCPQTACVADAAIFIGVPPKASRDMKLAQGILLAEENDTTAFREAARLPYPMTAVTMNNVYLTTRGNGEWRIRRWR